MAETDPLTGGTADAGEHIRALDAEWWQAYLGKADAHVRVADLELRVAAVHAVHDSDVRRLQELEGLRQQRVALATQIQEHKARIRTLQAELKRDEGILIRAQHGASSRCS